MFLIKSKVVKFIVFLFLPLFLVSCNSFSSKTDEAKVLYSYDSCFSNKNNFLNGTTRYGTLNSKEAIQKKAIKINNSKIKNFYKWQDVNSSELIKDLEKKANEYQIIIPSHEFWFLLDDFVLQEALNKSNLSTNDVDQYYNCLRKNGYVKYENEFANINKWNNEIIRTKGYDKSCSSDFIKIFQEIIKSKIQNISSYISLKDNTLYGNFGYFNDGVYLEPKNWNSLKFSSFDFIFIYPITYIIEKIVSKLGGINSNIAKILTIFIIVFGFKIVMMLFFSTKSNIDKLKIKFLQNKLKKIKEKFLAYDVKTQKQLFRQEQQKIFKKYYVSMPLIFIDSLIQLLFFLFMLSAIKASAILSTGRFLYLYVNKSVLSLIFQKPNILNGWLTALTMLILMILINVISFLFPNFIYKKIFKIKNMANENKLLSNFHSLTMIISSLIFQPNLYILIFIVCNSLFGILQTLFIHLLFLYKFKDFYEESF